MFTDYVKQVLAPFNCPIEVEPEGKHFDIYLVPPDSKTASHAVGAQGRTYQAVRQLLRAVAANQGLTCHYYVDTEDLTDWRGNR